MLGSANKTYAVTVRAVHLCFRRPRHTSVNEGVGRRTDGCGGRKAVAIHHPVIVSHKFAFDARYSTIDGHYLAYNGHKFAVNGCYSLADGCSVAADDHCQAGNGCE